MTWNWEDPDWPRFRFRADALTTREAVFLQNSGVVVGTTRHLPEEERLQLIVEPMSTEAVKTSEIEGAMLDRDRVRSSLRRQFGLQGDARRVEPAERGISEMLTGVYRSFADPLTDAQLFGWHQGLMQGRGDLRQVGGHRTHPEPMQVISGPIHEPKVHFEAPPSGAVPQEMQRFCAWFNATAPTGRRPCRRARRCGPSALRVHRPVRGR